MFTLRTVRNIIINILIVIFVVAVIASVVTSSRSVRAQNTGPDGSVNNSTPGSSTTANQGDGLTVVDVPIIPLGNGGDGLPSGMDTGNTDIQTEDPLAFDNILASFSYYRLLGTAFNVRTSTTTFAYNFYGCVYETGGTDNRFMAPLLIPENSVIKYLRLFFYDSNPGVDITSWLTRYQPGVTSEDLISVTSDGSSGYGETLSAEITHTVDLHSWAYTIIIAPNANSPTNSFCCVRVAYYAPTFSAVALPLVVKDLP